jgi:hypothetical protein
MKLLKGILKLLLGVIAIALIAAAILPKDYAVAETVSIKASQQKVFDYFRFLKNTEQYSTWVLDDPKATRTYAGTDGQVGGSQSWQGGEFGKGTQTIKSLSANKMEVELNFVEPMASIAQASYIFNAIDSNTTEVTSGFSGNSKWPFNLMSIFMGKKMISEAEQKSLANAKKILEAQ